MNYFLAASGSDLINPGIGLVFWMLVTFIILLFLLRKYAWGPILTAVKSREEGIRQALDSAEEAKKEMQNITADSEKLLKDARAERESMLKEAREIKDQMISEAKEQAESEGHKMIEKAKLTIEAEKKAALEDIKKQVATLSVAVAEKMLKEELSDDKKQQQYIEDSLKDIQLN